MEKRGEGYFNIFVIVSVGTMKNENFTSLTHKSLHSRHLTIQDGLFQHDFLCVPIPLM